MYEYIRGNIADISPANIIIEAGGIGYFINISLNSYSQLSGKKEAKLFSLIFVEDSGSRKRQG